jgi:hypothetical protein
MAVSCALSGFTEYAKSIANGEQALQPIIGGSSADIAEPANDNAVQQAEDHAALGGP